MEPVFLRLDEILEIHIDQIKRYGGSPAIRSLELLQSAFAAPEATFEGHYLHTDLYEMAAAYLFHLVQNHPFVDGNKRTGVVASLVFLELNGIEIDADENALAALVEQVAQGKADKSEISHFLKEHSHRS